VAIARCTGVVFAQLARPVIERVTFVATRRGSYKSPVAEAFRSALRSALTAAEDPDLPLEAYDPAHAVGEGRPAKPGQTRA